MILPHRIVVYLVDGAPPWALLPRAGVRNARTRNRRAPRLTFRPVGAAGAYPDWLRDLHGRAGAYVIRDLGGEVLYVGESEGGRLYNTVTRHFQSWGRSRKSRKSQLYGNGYYRRVTDNDPGTTYDRRSCEVAIVLTRPDRAVATQNQLIRKLAPRDNIQGQPKSEDLDDVPF